MKESNSEKSYKKIIDEKDILIKELQRSLQEKEVLIHEMHHRVKNNLQIILSLLTLQKRNLDNKNTIQLIIEIENKVFSIAVVHELLYKSQTNDKIKINVYFSRLIENLTQLYDFNPTSIQLKFNDPNIELDIGQSIYLGLIMNELVSNAIKHAFPGNLNGLIKIEQIIEPTRQFSMSISDDGKGLPNNIDLANPQSTGFYIVKILLQQLKANIKINRTNGTQFIIDVPK